jgi:hypothetical protein
MMARKELGVVLDCIDLAQDRVQWCFLVNKVTNIQVVRFEKIRSINARLFSNSRVTDDTLRKIWPMQ